MRSDQSSRNLFSPVSLWRKCLSMARRKKPYRKSGRSSMKQSLYLETLEDRIVPAMFEVTNFADIVANDGSLSLREAVIESNNTPGRDTIVLASGAIYNLSITGSDEDDAQTGDLDIRDDVDITVENGGTATITWEGTPDGQRDRVFHILVNRDEPLVAGTPLQANTDDGQSAATESTLLQDLLRVKPKFATGDKIEINGTDADGTAISASLTVTLNATTVGDLVTLINNAYSGAQASLDAGGTLSLASNNPSINDKLALTIRDGLGNVGKGNFPPFKSAGARTVEITGVTISGGRADKGGGIYNVEGTVTVTDGAIIDNVAVTTPGDNTTGKGGGVYNQAGSVTLFNSLLAGNNAAEAGAPFTNVGGLVTLTNSQSFNNTIGNDQSGESFLNDIVGLALGAQDDIVDGIDDLFDELILQLESTYVDGDLQKIPVIGNQFRDILGILTDSLEDARTDTVDFLGKVLSLPQDGEAPPMTELLQSALYLVLGPGDGGFNQLTPSVQQAFAPFREDIKTLGLGILKDGRDNGNEVNATDIVVSIADDQFNTRWIEFYMHLGQEHRFTLPEFDLGLGSLAALIPDGADRTALENFASNFAFDTSVFGASAQASNGLRADMTWDLRLGLGISERVDSNGGVYFSSGVTRSGRADDEGIEELRFSIDVFAAPSSESQIFKELFEDVVTTPNLSTTVSLGLIPITISDGTPADILITAPKGLPISVLGSPKGSFRSDLSEIYSVDLGATQPVRFKIAIDDQDPVEVTYQQDGPETLPLFLLNLNKAVAKAFAGVDSIFGIVGSPVSFTVDFSQIDTFFNPGNPTTPHLVLKARYPEISYLAIHDAEEFNFLKSQYENRRLYGMGFGNNTSSTAVEQDSSGRVTKQELAAVQAAPAEGVTVVDPEFFIWVGGERVRQTDKPLSASVPLTFTDDEFNTKRAATADTKLNDLNQIEHKYQVGDDILITGIDPDGDLGNQPAVNVSLQVDGDTTLGDLIAAISEAFPNATANLDAKGVITLVADDPAAGDTMVLELSDNRGNELPTFEGVYFTEGAKPIRMFFSEKLNRDTITTLEALRVKLQDIIESEIVNIVDPVTGVSYARDTISVEIDDNGTPEIHDDFFRLVSKSFIDQGANQFVEAPLLTVAFRVVDQTKLTIAGGIDFTDPDAILSRFDDFPNDQRTYNRMTISDITSADDTAEVLKPFLITQANVRLHATSDPLKMPGFNEQHTGFGKASLALPVVDFDIKFDAEADFGNFLKDDPEARDEFFDMRLQLDNVQLDVTRFLERVVVPVAESIASALEPVLSVLGDSPEDAEAFLNQRIDLISDIVGEDITVGSLLPDALEDTIEDITAALASAGGIGQDVVDLIRDESFKAGLPNGKFTFGGFELILDPSSSFYFPRTKIPIPTDLVDIANHISGLGLDNFLRTTNALTKFQPPGFSFDLIRPQTMFNLLTGQPFNIISFGLPTIDLDATAEFGFQFQDFSFNISAGASFDSNLRLVYDSYGFEQIVDAYAAGQSPDWSDLLDGLAIQNNPNGFELGASVFFKTIDPATGQTGPVGIKIQETDPLTGETITIFEASAEIDIAASLGFELIDPNNDGKLRLDEIFDITNDFANPEHLFCIFDVVGSASVNIGGKVVTPLGELINGDIGLATGELSLQSLLSNLFGLCDVAHTPILAQTVEEGGETVLRLNTGAFAGARQHGDTNDDSDPVLAIIENSDGSATLIEEDGKRIEYKKPGPDGKYQAVNEKELSFLRKQNGKFQRVYDANLSFGETITQFNAANKVESITQRAFGAVVNETIYDYTAAGELDKITRKPALGSDTTTQYYTGVSIEAGLRVKTVDGVVHVWGFGVSEDDAQTFAGIDRIIAVGSDFDDKFDFSAVEDIPVEVDGRDGDDTLLGGAGNDLLKGGSGNDNLHGNDGNDVIDVGAGMNVVSDGLGNDSVDFGRNEVGVTYVTGGGSDTVFGSRHDDVITAKPDETAKVVFEGDRGNDVLTGGAGSDVLDGGRGDDVLNGLAGNDLLKGESGNDTLYGGQGDDVLEGGRDDDSLIGSAGADELYGNQGDDRMIAGLGDTHVEGDTGVDHLIFAPENGHTATLTNFEYQVSGGTNTAYFAVESLEVQLSDEDDLLIIDGPALPIVKIDENGVSGGPGITTGAGNDQINIVNLPFHATATEISLQNGDDTVTVFDTQRELVLNAGDAAEVNGDRLVIDRSASPISRTGQATESLLTGSGIADIAYDDSFEGLEIKLGSGSDQYTVDVDTSSDTRTTIYAGAGDDQVFINSISKQTDAGNNPIVTTSINGEAGEDTVTVVIPGNPNLLKENEFAGLGFAVEQLHIDNTQNTTSTADWQFVNSSGAAEVFVGGTKILDTLGAVTTIFDGGGADGDTLIVQDDVNSPQKIAVDGNHIEVQEGANVLQFDSNTSFTGFNYVADVNGLDAPNAIAASPDGRFIYVVGTNDHAVSVFYREANGGLSLVQVVKDGELGVDGLNGATDIAISTNPNVTQVFVSSKTDDSIAIFDRIPETGRLAYRGFLNLNVPVSHLAITADGTVLYATSGNQLFRLRFDPSTRTLTQQGSAQTTATADYTALAVSSDGKHVYAVTGAEFQHYAVGNRIVLNSDDLTTFAGGGNDVAISPDNKSVYVAHDDGVGRYTLAGSVLTSNGNITLPGTPTATAIAVDPDGDRVVVSFDEGSVDEQPKILKTITLELVSIKAINVDDDGFEDNPEEDEVYFTFTTFTTMGETETTRLPIFGHPTAVIQMAAGNEVDLTREDAAGNRLLNKIKLLDVQPIDLPFELGDDIVKIYDQDSGDDDLLLEVTPTYRPGTDFTPGDPIIDRTVTRNSGGIHYELNYRLIGEFVDGPVVAAPKTIVTYTRGSDGSLSNATSIDASEDVSKLENLVVAPSNPAYGSQEFYGTSNPNDLVAKFRTAHNGDITDGDSQTVTAFAQPGADHVETVISSDGQHAYAISAKFGMLAVYERDPSTGEIGALIQNLPLGLLPGSHIAFQRVDEGFGDLDYVYVTNSAEDTLSIYLRNLDPESSDFGKLTLSQLFREDVFGVRGLDGAGIIGVGPNGTHIYVGSVEDNSISIFKRNVRFIDYEFVETFTHSDLNGLSSIQFTLGTSSEVYATSVNNDSVLVLSRTPTGGLLHKQTIRDGISGVDGIAHPVLVALDNNPNEGNVYVAGQGDDAIAVFARSAAGDELTFLDMVKNGSDGVHGIEGITSLIVSADNRYLFATGGGDTISVFERDSAGRLTLVQRLRNGSGGVSEDGVMNIVNGIDGATALTLSPDGRQLYVSSGGPEIGAGGVAVFDIEQLIPDPSRFVVDFSGVEDLTVQSAGSGDIVNAGEVVIPFTLKTQAGPDVVTVRNTGPNTTTNIELGPDGDVLNLMATGSGATTMIEGGAGNDQFNVFAVSSGSTKTDIKGGSGEDTFLVKGGHLDADLTIHGNSPSSDPGDTVIFDAHGMKTDPVDPQPSAGTVKIEGADFEVTYDTIEDIISIASPLANAGSAYAIHEGDSLTLASFNASGSILPPGQSLVSLDGFVNGQFIGSTSSLNEQVSATWDELVGLGINDDGVYQVTARVTSEVNGEQLFDIGSTTLTISNTAPTLTLSGANLAEAGSVYRLTMSANDPGNDAIQTWRVLWGDGSEEEIFFGNVATAEHVYATPGTFTISVTAIDEDGGPYGPVTKDIGVEASRWISGAQDFVDEGSVFTLDLNKPVSAGISAWTIYWGDGEQSTYLAGATNATHTYADDGVYRIDAVTRDTNGLKRTMEPVVVNVLNVAPGIVQIDPASATINQGDVLTIDVLATDPGINDALYYEFDFDNNGVFEVVSAGSAIEKIFTKAGTHTVGVRVRDDDDGVSEIDSFDVTVLNVAPIIDNVDVITEELYEATPITLRVNARDFGGPDDPLTYEFDFDNDGVFEIRSSVNTARHVFADNGVYTVNARVTDLAGEQAVISVDLNVQNLAPTATAPAPSGRVLEGISNMYYLGASDPAGDADPLQVAFDFDGDGVYETPANFNTETKRWEAEHTFADDTFAPPDEDGTITVKVRVTDDDGGVAETSAIINVFNVSPTIALSGEESVAEGEVFTLNLGDVTDPGDDTVTKYIVFWGDGTSDIYDQAGDVTHTYTNTFGAKTIRVHLVDEDVDYAGKNQTHLFAGEHRVFVTGAGIIDGTLFVIGYDEDDHVTINQQDNNKIKVHASFFANTNFKTFTASEVGRIVVYLNGGDDHATIAGDVDKPVILDGGADDDHLKAGGGPTILIGGAGDDHLIGNQTRNILIGGLGKDKIEGKNGGNILIGGSTVYDSDIFQWRALDAMLTEWNSELCYAERIDRIQNPSSEDAAKLKALETVFDDGESDELSGGSGLDWYFASLDDDVKNKKADEILDLL